jgi:hypothetical protein
MFKIFQAEPSARGQISRLNFRQNYASNRVAQLLAEADWPNPDLSGLSALRYSRLADALERTPVPQRGTLLGDVNSAAASLVSHHVQTTVPVMDWDMPRPRAVIEREAHAVVAGLGPALSWSEPASRMHLTALVARERGYQRSGDEHPAQAIGQLVDRVMREPPEQRPALAVAVGHFHERSNTDLDVAITTLQRFPPQTWETIAIMSTRGRDNSPMSTLAGLAQELERLPAEQHEEAVKLLSPFKNPEHWPMVVETLQSLPPEQWREHTARIHDQHYSRYGGGPPFGLLTRALYGDAQVVREPEPQLPDLRPNLETHMDVTHIGWTKSAIAALLQQVKKPKLSVAETVEEIVAEIALVRESGGPDFLLAERGGVSELDHALRTLKGERQSGDYSFSLLESEDFITLRDGKALKVGDLLAHAWEAAKRHSPAGLKGEALEAERRQFKHRIIDQLGKCIEIDDRTKPPEQPDPPHRVCNTGISGNLADSLVDRIAGVTARVYMAPRELLKLAFQQLSKEVESQKPTEARLAEWAAEVKAEGVKGYKRAEDIEELVSGIDLGVTAYETVEDAARAAG